jgi:hypothetical protein
VLPVLCGCGSKIGPILGKTDRPREVPLDRSVVWGEARPANDAALLRLGPFDRMGAIPAVEAVSDSALREGPYYRLDDEVYSDGRYDYYRLYTSFGIYDVTSQTLLARRIREVGITAELKQLSAVEIGFEAAGQKAIDVVTGPAAGVGRLVGLVSDPEAAFETVGQVPEGLGNMVSTAQGAVSDVYSGVSGIAANGLGEACSGPGCVRRNQLALEDRASDFLRDKIGQTSRVRALRQQYGVDPYTDNQELIEALEEAAWVRTSMDFALDFVPVGVAVPGMGLVSDINGYYGRLSDIASYRDPGESARKTRADIAEIGVSEDVAAALVSNPAYDPAAREALLSALRDMPRVEGRGAFLQAAAMAASPPQALDYAVSAEAFLYVHRHETPLLGFVVAEGLPGAVTKDGRMLAMMPISDRLAWTERNAKALLALSDASRARLGPARLELRLRGPATPRAAAALAGLGYSLRERHVFPEEADKPEEEEPGRFGAFSRFLPDVSGFSGATAAAPSAPRDPLRNRR